MRSSSQLTDDRIADQKRSTEQATAMRRRPEGLETSQHNAQRAWSIDRYRSPRASHSSLRVLAFLLSCRLLLFPIGGCRGNHSKSLRAYNSLARIFR